MGRDSTIRQSGLWLRVSYRVRRRHAALRDLVMVRKRGFEPPLGCPNQLLRLARLPFRHFRMLQQISPQAGTPSIAQAVKADRPRAAGMTLMMGSGARIDGKRARASLASPLGKTGEF